MGVKIIGQLVSKRACNVCKNSDDAALKVAIEWLMAYLLTFNGDI